MDKVITLVTPGHVSSNPRLLKEAVTFASAGYIVWIVYTRYLPFLSDMDDQFFRNNQGIQSVYLDWTGTGISSWVRKSTSGLLNKLITAISSCFQLPVFAAFLLNRHYAWQTRTIRKTKPTLIIAHNLGALPPAGKARIMTRSLLAFDAEDFHRGEPIATGKDGWIVQSVENRWIPLCDLTWCASPMIGNKYRDLFPAQAFYPILNVFPSRYIRKKEVTSNNPIPPETKLFWFSQTIGKDRGLEDVFHAINHLQPRKVTLTLIGMLSETDRVYFQNLSDNLGLPPGSVHYSNQVPEHQLFEMGQSHDFGLALERRYPENRNVCLTNKIFTYLSCGLAVIYTSTDAQTAFWNEHPESGILYDEGNIDQLSVQLARLIDSPEKLVRMKNYSASIAKSRYHWESEADLLLNHMKENILN